MSNQSNFIDGVERQIKQVTKTIDTVVAPTRQSFANRYPVVFSLLVTVGVIMTFLGIEQILLSTTWLENHPILILGIGIGILALTGTLYKTLR